MYTIYTVNLINENCPQGAKPDNCPLRKYVNSGSSLFHVSVNETHLIPRGKMPETLVEMYNKMHAICEKCHADNQKVK